MGVAAQTVWLIAGVLAMFSGLLVMALRRRYTDHMGRAMNLWGWACVSLGTALGLSAQSQHMAESIGPPLAGIIAMVLQYIAVTELKQQKRQRLWIWSPAFVTCATFAWFSFLQPNVTIRLLLFNCIRLVMMLRIASSFAEKENGRRQFVDMLAAGIYMLLAISTVGVIVDFLLHSHFTVEYNFNSARTVYNGAAIAVSQTLLFTLFLLAITERLNIQFQEEAMHDPLTGLFNRRAIEEIGFHQKSLALRSGQAFSAFMIDVDNFKQVNDMYGHTTGDFFLKTVALAIRRGLRDEDYVGRWGGDEFCVLLPGANREQAERVAERVMEIFEGMTFAVDEIAIPLSLSIGGATIEESVGGFARLIELADAALYQAKRSGKQRYAFADSAYKR